MRAPSVSFSASLLALSLTACSSLTPATATPNVDAPKPAVAPVAKPTPKPTPAEQASFASSSNGLGYDLYAKLAAKPGNLAFSPASIETALSMTWAGSKGETAEQMKRVLHLGDDPSLAVAGAEKTLGALTAPHDGYELAVADRLFGEKSYPFDPAFLSLEESRFGAGLETVDFRHAFEAGRQSVNGFVKKSTMGHITDLLPEGSVSEETRLVLVNAVYMHAKWSSPFAKSATSDQTFFSAGGSSLVPTMRQTSELRYADVGDASVLDMPYAGGDLAMTVILPKDVDGLSKVEGELHQGSIEAMVGALHDARVDVTLPRFKAAAAQSIALRGTLAALGMPLAFDDRRADFTGMGKPGAERLHIDDAYHKAFVDVDEEGTTAAAATAVVMNREMAVSVEPKAVAFHADHPFVYVIRDVHTNLVLFMGRVVDPAA